MTTIQDRRTKSARQRQAAHTRAVARDLAMARPFQIPLCARCGTGLCDRAGNPRWDVVGDMRLVCLGGCKAIP